MVGPVNSGVALAIIDIAQKNQVPLMDTVATAEQIIERYKNAPKNYIFRVSLNDGIQTSFMIDYIKGRQYQRVGLMHDSTGWGQSGRDTALRIFKEQGGDFHPVATAQTYDGVRLLLRALDKVGPDPQKIRDALEEIDDFTEAVTKMKPHPFSQANHESLGRDTGFLAVWHDGKLARASD